MHEIAGVSVNESFEPGASFIVLDLDDMGKSQGAIFLRHKFEGSGVVIKLPIQGAFRLGDSIIEGN